MLIFGTIEFGTMNIHGNTTEIAVVQYIKKRNCTQSVEGKQAIIAENEGLDYIDTDEYKGQILYSDEAFNKSRLSYGINEDTKVIALYWDLDEMQDYFCPENFGCDHIPDDAMWQMMQTAYHKTGVVDIEDMKDRVWEYQRNTLKQCNKICV